LLLVVWRLFHPTPPASSQAESGPTVLVQLIGIPHINDRTVEFTLDGNPIEPDKLGGMIKIGLGEHDFRVSRDGVEIELRRFRLGAENGGKRLILPEPDPPKLEDDQILCYKLPANSGVTRCFFLPDGRPGTLLRDPKQTWRSRVYIWNAKEPKADAVMEM